MLKSDAEDSAESGSGSDDDDHSGSRPPDLSAADFGRRQGSFYDSPGLDYGLSFDIPSRLPPVEVVTRRIHGHVTAAGYPQPTDTSSQLQPSSQLISVVAMVAVVFLCSRRYVAVAETSHILCCFSTC